MRARTIAQLGLFWVAVCLGCKSGDPLAPEGCTVELTGACWTLLGLETEWVAEIAVTPWGLFVGTRDHGIFHLDAERRWRALGPARWHEHLIPQALLYVPTVPPRLLAGVHFRNGSMEDTTRAAVYASYDRGRSWVPSDGGLETDPAANTYRVFALDLEVDPGDPRRVFLTTYNGVLRSLDAGETWAYVVGDFDNFSNGFPDVLIDPTRSGRVWYAGVGAFGEPHVGVSADWGDTWNGGLLSCLGTVYETAIWALAFDPNRPRRLWAGLNGGLMWADDGGEVNGSWQCGDWVGRGDVMAFAELEGTLFAATAFLTDASDPERPETWVTGLGLYRTADGGTTWESLPAPTEALGATTAVADPGAGRLLIGTPAGLWAVRP
jgi:hypothetical protein